MWPKLVKSVPVHVVEDVTLTCGTTVNVHCVHVRMSVQVVEDATLTPEAILNVLCICVECHSDFCDLA